MAPPEPTTQDTDEVEGTRMTLGEHLDELRKRLIRGAVALGVVFAVLYSQRHALFEFVQGPHHRSSVWLNEARAEHWDAHVQELLEAEAAARAEAEAAGEVFEPADPVDPREWFEDGYPERKVLNARFLQDETLSIFSPDGGFVLKLRLCFWLSLFVAGPYMLWELWRFIAAGLYRHERKVVHRYVPWSIGLFVGGVVFGYLVMVPYALYFLGLDNLTSPALNSGTQVADQYLQFLKGLALALGFVFQLPVVMLALTRLELVEPKQFAHYRRHTIVGALVLAAILTPPDPVTQLMLAGPVILLYETGMLLSRLTHRRAAR